MRHRSCDPFSTTIFLISIITYCLTHSGKWYLNEIKGYIETFQRWYWKDGQVLTKRAADRRTKFAEKWIMITYILCYIIVFLSADREQNELYWMIALNSAVRCPCASRTERIGFWGNFCIHISMIFNVFYINGITRKKPLNFSKFYFQRAPCTKIR